MCVYMCDARYLTHKDEEVKAVFETNFQAL